MRRLKRVEFIVAAIFILLFISCGGGIDGTNIYTVGGTVSGLSGTLVLQNNGGNSHAISSNGHFVFPTALTNGTVYNLTVSSQPVGQTCTVSNGSGTIQSADIDGVQIVCADDGVTLSGRIAVTPGVVVDSDVNNPKEDYASNDVFESAQRIPNPVSVAGYVNQPKSGAPGRSFESGDMDDYFLVELGEGDAVTLAIGESDAVNNDLDIYIYGLNRELVYFSVGTGRYEISPPVGINDDFATGTYFVRVTASSGASNYILTVGADMYTEIPDAERAKILSNRHEMVPGQVVVRFKDDVMPAVSPKAFTRYAAGMMMKATAGSPERAMLFNIDDPGYQAYVHDARNMATQTSYKQESAGNAEKARILNTLLAVKELRKQSDIRCAEPNYIRRPYNTEVHPDDPGYIYQWNYPFIHLPEAWGITTGGDDVIVAVIDTGVLVNHPDFRDRLADTGYNFASGEPDGIGPDPNDPGDKSPGTGVSNFHGTHVAGVIGAATNNGEGVAGVTWNTKIMPVRVMSGGGGSNYDLMQGVLYAAGLENDSGTVPDKPADIINLSLGGRGYSSMEQEIFDRVRAEGIIVVAAAGNDNTSRPDYPASYDGVISVSAVNRSGAKARYSNYGSRVDVAAPGGELNRPNDPNRIYSTQGDDSGSGIKYNYGFNQGTSMAAPHVSGTAALMKAVYPALSPYEFEALLINGKITDEIGDSGSGKRDDYYGYGLINAFKAVVAARELAAGASAVGFDANPKVVNFGVAFSVASITVSKIGEDEISISGISISADWLAVTPGSSVDNGGFGEYALFVDRSGLAEKNVYVATVVFTASSGATVSVGVTAQGHPADVHYNAGYHYVLLIGIDNDGNANVVDQKDVKTSDGYYHYAFTGVSAGRYMVVAGSDRNNDGYIDDDGESTGAYPAEIEITRERNDLNFSTGLRLFITSAAAPIKPELKRMK